MYLTTFLTSGQNKIQFDSHHYIRLHSIILFCVLSHYIILPWPTLQAWDTQVNYLVIFILTFKNEKY